MNRQPLRFLLLLSTQLLLTLSFLFGEIDFDIESKIFIPPVYYVGDEVELRLKVNISHENLNIQIPEELPSTEWIEIKHISYTWFQTDVINFTINFITFQPGKHILPPVDLGDIILEGIESETQSILMEREIKKMSPRKGQVELPGTRLAIGFLIALVILLPVAGILLYRNILWIINRFRKIRQKELPRNKLKRILKKLERSIKEMSSREFYIRIAEAIKEYLSRRLLIPALTLTTRELNGFFTKNINDSTLKNKVSRFAEILRFSDMVKFGGENPNESESLETINEIIRIVDAMEEEYDRVES